VLGIVRAHKGGIRVDSLPGSGTRVVVYLPVSTESLSLPITAVDPDRSPTPQEAGEGRPLVLVVDDEDAVRRVAQMMLRHLGYGAIAAAEGQNAVELFERNLGQIRAVLLDLTMPRMNGPEVLAAIRRIDPAVPVVLCSGYAAEAVSETLAATNTYFLLKPFTMADLGRAMREAVGGRAES
jgi:CheY-like chemotaxis protein